MSPDSLSQCANAGGLVWVGFLAGLIVGAVATLWAMRK